MLLSAALILATASGQSFGIDELTYYGRVVDKAGRLIQYDPFDAEYLIAPFNGHLALGGRFVYELIFTTVGADYEIFVIVNIVALVACVALVFELARRRVGSLAALPLSILLLFLGFASETLLWPFNLHTLFSLALGLGAVLTIQRNDRRGDVFACILLILSIATLEVGLAFALGISVWLWSQDGRFRRMWIVVTPLAMYGAWWLWARRFEQSEAAASNLTTLPKTFLDAIASTLGSLTGTDPVIPASYLTGITWFTRALAIVAVGALVLRLWRGRPPQTIWTWLVVLATYWLFLAVAARPPEAARYIFVGAAGAVLVAMDAIRGSVSDRLAGALAVVVLLALPANIAQLVENRDQDVLHLNGPVSRTEFAMVELAAPQVDPTYVVSADPRVAAAGGGLYIGLSAGAYLRAADHNGSLAFSLDEVKSQPAELRNLADVALVDALGLGLERSRGPTASTHCRAISTAPGAGVVTFRVPPGETILRTRGRRPLELGLRRFADVSSSVRVGWLQPGKWMRLVIPPDRAREPWRAVVNAPVTACVSE
jgi:hypothetical protein